MAAIDFISPLDQPSEVAQQYQGEVQQCSPIEGSTSSFYLLTKDGQWVVAHTPVAVGTTINYVAKGTAPNLYFALVENVDPNPVAIAGMETPVEEPAPLVAPAIFEVIATEVVEPTPAPKEEKPKTTKRKRRTKAQIEADKEAKADKELVNVINTVSENEKDSLTPAEPDAKIDTSAEQGDIEVEIPNRDAEVKVVKYKDGGVRVTITPAAAAIIKGLSLDLRDLA